MNRKEALSIITEKLRKAGADSPAFDASELVDFVLGKVSRAFPENTDISKEQEDTLLSLCGRRVRGEPLQYILGQWEFYGFPFKVGPGVLIPRDDTEVALRAAFEHLDTLKSPKILDLCAGSGTLAVTLKKLYPNSEVTAVELSDEAFSYLKENAELNNADVKLIKGDVFEVHSLLSDSYFDLIISNPPYLTTEELKDMQNELYFEPAMALDGGEDGCDFYRAIIPLYTPKLKSGGELIFELDGAQAEYTAKLLESFSYEKILILDDLGDIHRVIKGTLV